MRSIINLDERKKKILKAIIDGYIKTADPIGSRTLAKKYMFGLSSATIRNEMADLEELGYLEQPHTSAGRIPSDKGYRYYVDSMIQPLLDSDNSIYHQILQSELKSNTYSEEEINEIIKKASRLLSRLSRYTSIVLTPQINKSKIKTVKLVSIDDQNILLIVITNTGLIRNVKLHINKPADQSELDRVGNLLSDVLSGLSIYEMNQTILDKLKFELKYDTMFDSILDIIKNVLMKADDTDIMTDGASNIFNYPEYNDINKVKSFLSLLEEKSMLYDVMNPENYKGMSISIGSENKFSDIKDLSIIIATYCYKGKPIGSIGIIGPTRMDYTRVISLVSTANKEISNIIKILCDF